MTELFGGFAPAFYEAYLSEYPISPESCGSSGGTGADGKKRPRSKKRAGSVTACS